MARIILLGTCDTKFAELGFLRERILAHGAAEVILLDVGRTSVADPAITISPEQLLAKYGKALPKPTSIDELRGLPRGEMLAVTSALAVACVRDLLKGDVSGIVAAGGSGNTSVAAAAMKVCPVGFPKLLVSTIACGDVAPIVGEADVTLMYSVIDIAGLNSTLRHVLDNAAGAIAGMAAAYASRAASRSVATALSTGNNTDKPALQVGITMFGATTPCVDAARRKLEAQGAEVYVFHATGSGGKALERLVGEGALDAVLDVTTTEICDLVVGGVMSAGPERLRAALKRGIPYIVSLGACDMVNFGARTTVPEHFNTRRLLEHNSIVTIMRTNEKECAEVGAWIARRLREGADQACVELWIPEGGVSLLDVPGQPFCDPAADQALVDALTTGLEGSGIRIVRDSRAINDVGFAVNMADRLVELCRLREA